MDNVIEMSNIEIFEFCKLDLNTGEKSFYENYHDFEDFNGFYFKDEKTFFAIFASSEGPKLYFKDRQYDLKKNLHITLKKMRIVEILELKNIIFQSTIVPQHT